MTSASIHGERDIQKPPKAGRRAMVAESNLPHDEGELLKVRPLRGEHRVTFEERQDMFEQIAALAHHENQRSITSAVRLDVTATQPLSDQLEYLSPVAVLADMELGYELKSDAAGRIALHRHGEASFSVDVTRDVAIQPFLLIVRTRHIVTIVNARPDADDE